MSKAAEPAATRGREVKIKDLVGRKDLNGQQGRILEEEDPKTGRLAVRVFTSPGLAEEVRIKRANIEVQYNATKISNENPDLCPICYAVEMHVMIGERQNATVMACCGQKSCAKCYLRILAGTDPDRCHFCRADTSDTSDATMVKQLQKRADRGDENAMYNLAAYYDMGTMGLVKDQKKAREMYKVAADKGHSRAANDYAVSCRDAEGGPQDFAEARKYYIKAIELGHVKAMTSLGSLYINGLGGKQDLEAAKELFVKAGNAGDELGRKYARSFFGV